MVFIPATADVIARLLVVAPRILHHHSHHSIAAGVRLPLVTRSTRRPSVKIRIPAYTDRVVGGCVIIFANRQLFTLTDKKLLSSAI